MIWNMNELYIFNIQTLEKIRTIPTKTSIKQVVVLNDKICALVKSNSIFMYGMDSYEEVKFYSYVGSYQELNQLLKIEERKELINHNKKEGRKRVKKNWPGAISLTDEAPWKPTDIRGILNINNRLFLNIDWNYLELEKDFTREEHDGINYLFLKKESVENENRYFYSGKFWTIDYPSYENLNRFTLIVVTEDFKTRKEYELLIPEKENKKLVHNKIVHLDDNYCYLLSRWTYEDNKEVESYTLSVIESPTRKVVNEIILPDEPRGGNIYTNPFYYTCYHSGSVYKISYNDDESFDVLKVGIR